MSDKFDEDGALINEAQPAPIGHNRPPHDPLDPIALRLKMSEDEVVLLDRVKEIQGGVLNFTSKYTVEQEIVVRGKRSRVNVIVIPDAEVQGKAGDFIAQMQQAAKVAKDHFDRTKKPYWNCGKAVDVFFNDIKSDLESAMSVVRQPMNVFALNLEAAERAEALRIANERAEQARQVAQAAQRAEAERQAAEDAARAASLPAPLPPIEPGPTLGDAISAAQIAEEAAKDAAGSSADFSRVRGDFGSVSSLRTNVTVILMDLSLVPLEFLSFNETAARRAAIAGRADIPGVKIVREKNVNVR